MPVSEIMAFLQLHRALDDSSPSLVAATIEKPREPAMIEVLSEQVKLLQSSLVGIEHRLSSTFDVEKQRPKLTCWICSSPNHFANVCTNAGRKCGETHGLSACRAKASGNAYGTSVQLAPVVLHQKNKRFHAITRFRCTKTHLSGRTNDCE